jgi:hypothetical protein
MKYTQFVLLVALVVSLSGCAAKKNILTSMPQDNNILLEGKPINVEIIDLRSEITQRQLRIPIMTWPGQKDKVQPPLTDFHRKLIEDQILLHFNQSNQEFKVKCIIEEGFQEFTAHALHEREYVQFDIKIELLDTRDNVIKYCTSTAFFEVKSLDASNSFIDELYNKVIITSINECFIKLADES